jgi:hypothetical protein
LYVTQRWNVLIDIKPSTGNRILMSTAPGMIWSDEDYYQNDEGMILMETTLQSGDLLPSTYDFILWYAKNKPNGKTISTGNLGVPHRYNRQRKTRRKK